MKKALVVEDDYAVSLGLRFILEDLGAEADWASNAIPRPLGLAG